MPGCLHLVTMLGPGGSLVPPHFGSFTNFLQEVPYKMKGKWGRLGSQQGPLDINTRRCQHSQERLVLYSQLSYFSERSLRKQVLSPPPTWAGSKIAIYLEESRSHDLNSRKGCETSHYLPFKFPKVLPSLSREKPTYQEEAKRVQVKFHASVHR